MYKYFALFIFIFPFTAHASAIEKLKTFIASTHSAQAEFMQEVQDKKGKRIQSASGSMQFVRPGKFRWEYRKPYEQVIVGDGVKFWLHDVELNQVTVKKMDAALGSDGGTPPSPDRAGWLRLASGWLLAGWLASFLGFRLAFGWLSAGFRLDSGFGSILA